MSSYPKEMVLYATADPADAPDNRDEPAEEQTATLDLAHEAQLDSDVAKEQCPSAIDIDLVPDEADTLLAEKASGIATESSTQWNHQAIHTATCKVQSHVQARNPSYKWSLICNKIWQKKLEGKHPYGQFCKTGYFRCSFYYLEVLWKSIPCEGCYASHHHDQSWTGHTNALQSYLAWLIHAWGCYFDQAYGLHIIWD